MVSFNLAIYSSFILCPDVAGFIYTHTLDVTGMCDICAFSREVKEVDVSGSLL